MPGAIVHSVDVWGEEGDPHEIAIHDVRNLEVPPADDLQVRPYRTTDYALPLADESVDLVVFGFGTHEIPDDGSLDKLFAEARRVLKPGGKAVMFEHGNDFHNTIIFGPVIGHVIPRDKWAAKFKAHFAGVGYARSRQAVDLFWGTKGERVGTESTPMPVAKSRRANPWIWIVIASFTLISAAVVAILSPEWLVPIYWAIAISGVTWPWIMIGVSLLSDRLTRRKPKTLKSVREVVLAH